MATSVFSESQWELLSKLLGSKLKKCVIFGSKIMTFTSYIAMANILFINKKCERPKRDSQKEPPEVFYKKSCS